MECDCTSVHAKRSVNFQDKLFVHKPLLNNTTCDGKKAKAVNTKWFSKPKVANTQFV